MTILTVASVCPRDGSPLRAVLVMPDFVLYHCTASAHSVRVGAQPFDREAPGASAHLNPRARGGRPPTVKPQAQRPCGWCARTLDGTRCARHGGPSMVERDRQTALAHYYRKKARRSAV